MRRAFEGATPPDLTKGVVAAVNCGCADAELLSCDALVSARYVLSQQPVAIRPGSERSCRFVVPTLRASP